MVLFSSGKTFLLRTLSHPVQSVKEFFRTDPCRNSRRSLEEERGQDHRDHRSGEEELVVAVRDESRRFPGHGKDKGKCADLGQMDPGLEGNPERMPDEMDG